MTATWQRRPARTVGQMVTACYLPDLDGQDYRDMHAELLRVARMADMDAAATEADFGDLGAPVLVVRWHEDGDSAGYTYLTVEPGNHLGYDSGGRRLTECTDAELAQWWVFMS